MTAFVLVYRFKNLFGTFTRYFTSEDKISEFLSCDDVVVCDVYPITFDFVEVFHK